MENKQRRITAWLKPLWYALPLAAAMAAAWLRWGGKAMDMISVAVKMVVAP